MNGRAVTKFIRVSPRKARIVADLVRGKRVDQAIEALALTPKKVSPILSKTIMSALANARQVAPPEESRIEDSGYIVKEIRIDEGPTMKRIRPRAQGRAFRILKRTSHIAVTVSPAQ
jgi:large subunit ribosomal protein L22